MFTESAGWFNSSLFSSSVSSVGFSGEGNRTKSCSKAHLRLLKCRDWVYVGNLTAAHGPPYSMSHFLFLVLHITKKLCKFPPRLPGSRPPEKSLCSTGRGRCLFTSVQNWSSVQIPPLSSWCCSGASTHVVSEDFPFTQTCTLHRFAYRLGDHNVLFKAL